MSSDELTRGKMRKLSPATAAYIAGVIDCDGNISIIKKKGQRPKSSTRGYNFALTISATNTKKDLVDWLKRVTGVGQVLTATRGNVRSKQPYRWTVWSNQALQLLQAILPYMVIKQRQAELAVRFQKSKRLCAGRGGLSASEWKLQEDTHASMRTLNQRGMSA